MIQKYDFEPRFKPLYMPVNSSDTGIVTICDNKKYTNQYIKSVTTGKKFDISGLSIIPCTIKIPGINAITSRTAKNSRNTKIPFDTSFLKDIIYFTPVLNIILISLSGNQLLNAESLFVPQNIYTQKQFKSNNLGENGDSQQIPLGILQGSTTIAIIPFLHLSDFLIHLNPHNSNVDFSFFSPTFILFLILTKNHSLPPFPMHKCADKEVFSKFISNYLNNISNNYFAYKNYGTYVHNGGCFLKKFNYLDHAYFSGNPSIASYHWGVTS